MDSKIVEKLFHLLRNEIVTNTEDDTLKESITEQELPELFKIAKKHDLAHIVGDSLDKIGVLKENSQARKVFLQERNMAVFRYEQLNYDLERISAGLEEEKIEHIPLKGSVIRKFYPEPWLRTSCDIDILIRESDKERAKEVFENKLNCEYKSTWDYEQSFFTESGTHIELHHSLDCGKFEEKKFLSEIWQNAVAVDGKAYRKELADEWFYFYHFAHMAKHFETGGCGIKPFMDVWILNNRMPKNTQRRYGILERGGLLEFAKASEKLAEIWFSGQVYDDLSLKLEEYVLYGGVYGNTENRVLIGQQKKGGKFRYILYRIFLPYDELKNYYPKLNGKKWLTPIYQFKRWFRLVFVKGTAKKSLAELNTSNAVSKDTQDKTQKLLRDLGLM